MRHHLFRTKVGTSPSHFHSITNPNITMLSLSLLLVPQNVTAEMSSYYEYEGEIFSDGVARKVMASRILPPNFH